jgi:glycosyltransferase involved in cell wall biosynthesis
MRFHTPALPGQPVTRENSRCAFTQKVRKFKPMMQALGHEVIIYGGGAEADVECDPFDSPPPFEAEAWKPFNDRVIAAIGERAEPGDILGLMCGRCQAPIAAEFPEMLPCEYGIGYAGCFADFKVFESYAWMHTVYGQTRGTDSAYGSFFDAVIPGYFDTREFPEHRFGGDDYLVFVGRMIERKGPHIAAEVAERLGLPLFLAGEGDFVPSYGEFLGPLGPDERSELIAGARALLAPTIYVEPFGNTAVEAQLCGTPAITTDWGAYPETVEHGVSGYRCHTLAEFIEAVEQAPSLDHEFIRAQAQSLWGMEAVGPRYETYFRRLELVRGAGWYEGVRPA